MNARRNTSPLTGDVSSEGHGPIGAHHGLVVAPAPLGAGSGAAGVRPGVADKEQPDPLPELIWQDFRMPRMLSRMRPPWCPHCHASPGPDCPDVGRDRKRQRAVERREIATEIRADVGS